MVCRPTTRKFVHHKIFDLRLQQASHWDAADTDPLEVARVEIVEETAVRLSLGRPSMTDNPSVQLDINTYPIPENIAKAEAAHYHRDFRYVFTTKDE